MSTSPTGRLTYLDQFRGYTILGMILVNYLGDIPKHIHPVLRHHNTYCSYADTIMPQFFFAVGFALRFTMVKRLKTEGWWPAHGRVVKRVLALLMIAAIVHGFDNVKMSWDILCEQGVWQWLKQCCSRNFFQTLTHIAVTTLWVLPVIGARWPVRLLWLIASAWLHVALSQEFYLKFVFTGNVIDGGPLGFRLAAAHPDRVRGLIVQNAVANVAGWNPAVLAQLEPYWHQRDFDERNPKPTRW